MNGHYKVIFASIKLLLYCCVLTLQWKISLNIVACIMELTMVVWNACCWPDIPTIGWWCVRWWRLQLRSSWWSWHCWHWGVYNHGWRYFFNNLNVPKGSSTPMDWTLVYLHETMAKINAKCTVGATIELFDNATSFLWGVPSNIHHLHLAQINKSMH